MFQPLFSLAYILIWAALFGAYLAIAWWRTGTYPGPVYRAVIAFLAVIAAHYLEAELSRWTKRRRLPRTSHRKTPTGGAA